MPQNRNPQDDPLKRLRELAGEGPVSVPTPAAVQEDHMLRLRQMAGEAGEADASPVVPARRPGEPAEPIRMPGAVVTRPEEPPKPREPSIAEKMGEAYAKRRAAERGEFSKGVLRRVGSAIAATGRVLEHETPEYPPGIKARFGDIPPADQAIPKALIKRGDEIGEQGELKPKVGRFKDIRSVGDAVAYGASALGEQAVTTGSTLVAALVGGPGSAAAMSYVQNKGDIEKELEDLDVDPKKKELVSNLIGVPVSALDVIGIDVLAGLVKKKLGEGVTKLSAKEVLKGTGKGMLAEGGTETIQESGQYVGTRVGTGKPVVASELGERALESGVQGVLMGGVAGGAGTAAKGVHDAPLVEEQARDNEFIEKLKVMAGEKVQIVDRDEAIEQQVGEETTPPQLPPVEPPPAALTAEEKREAYEIGYTQTEIEHGYVSRDRIRLGYIWDSGDIVPATDELTAKRLARLDARAQQFRAIRSRMAEIMAEGRDADIRYVRQSLPSDSGINSASEGLRMAEAKLRELEGSVAVTKRQNERWRASQPVQPPVEAQQPPAPPAVETQQPPQPVAPPPPAQQKPPETGPDWSQAKVEPPTKLKPALGGMVFRRVRLPDGSFVDVMVGPPKGGRNAWGDERLETNTAKIIAKAQELAARFGTKKDSDISFMPGDANNVHGMPTENEGEYVAGPAFRIGNRIIGGGMAHADIMEWAVKVARETKDPAAIDLVTQLLDAYENRRREDTGFVTNTGRFIDRDEMDKVYAEARAKKTGNPNVALPQSNSVNMPSWNEKYGFMEIGEVPQQEEGDVPGPDDLFRAPISEEDLNRKLEELKKRAEAPMSAEERRQALETSWRLMREDDIDLAGMTADEWWDALTIEERQQAINTFFGEAYKGIYSMYGVHDVKPEWLDKSSDWLPPTPPTEMSWWGPRSGPQFEEAWRRQAQYYSERPLWIAQQFSWVREALFRRWTEMVRGLPGGGRIPSEHRAKKGTPGHWLLGDPDTGDVQAMPLTGRMSERTKRDIAFRSFAQKAPIRARILKALGFGPRDVATIKSLHQIAVDLFEAFNVPYRQGRGNFKALKALGWFNPHTGVVRMQWAGNAKTAFHEFGHFVSKRFLHNPTMKGAIARNAPGLNMAIRKELLAMGKALYGNRQPSGGYQEEGIAEWGRYYVIDPSVLQQHAPNFSKFMETTVFVQHPELKAILDATKAAYNDYQNADVEAQAEAMMADPPKGRWARFRDFLAKDDWGLAASWFQDTPVVEDVENALVELGGKGKLDTLASPYKALQSTRHLYGIVEEQLKTGVISMKSRRPVTRGYFQIWRGVPEEKRQSFRNYLFAERVMEEFEKGVTASNMTIEQAKTIIARHKVEFEPLAKEIWKISEALIDQRVDVGLLTPQEGDAIKALNKKRYGPMHRVFDEDETARAGIGPSGRRMAQNSSGTPALRGSPREIIPPDEAMVRDLLDTTRRVISHEAFLKMVKLALRTDGGGLYLEEVPAPKTRISMSLNEIRKQLIAMGMDPYSLHDKQQMLAILSQRQGSVDPNLSVQELVKLIEDEGLDPDNFMMEGAVHAFRELKQQGPAETKDLVIPVLIRGNRRWFQVKDKQLYDAVLGLGPHELVAWSNIVGNLTEKATRTLRAGATLTFDFMAGNFWRDAWNAAIYTKSNDDSVLGRQQVPFYMMARGINLMLKHPELVRQWRREGGQGGAMISRDREQTRDLLETATRQPLGGVKGVLRHPIEAMSRMSPIEALRVVSEVIENATRLGEYEQVARNEKKKGKSRREALATGAHASGDVTLRFSGGGKASRQVNRAIAFFNVSMLDMRKFQQEFATAKDPKRRKALVLRSIALITVPSVILAALQADDEEYLAIPQWQRNAHWILIDRDDNGKVKHIWRFPKANGLLGYVFGTIPERLVLWMKTGDEEHLKSLAGAFAQTWVPNLIPTIAAPVLENAMNRSSLRGSKIVPRTREELVKSEQVADYTGDFARQVGQWATHVTPEGVSPAKFENLVQGYTGSLGRYMLNLADYGTRAGRALTGQEQFPTPTRRIQDWVTQTPILRRFSIREPLEDAESVQRLYREYFSAEAKRKTYWDMVGRRERARARAYLADHREDILSVGTERELGEGRQGPLREAFEQLQAIRSAARNMPPEQRRNIGRMVRSAAERPGVRESYRR